MSAPISAGAVALPPLRYYGSKWRLAPWLLSFFPHHRVYVEPYGGGAAVLLRKAPAEIEVYNDLDGGAVNFFRVLRDQAEALQRAIDLTPFAWQEFDLSLREPDAGDDIERARRFFVRSWQSRGGGRGTMRAGWRRAVNAAKGPRAIDEWLRADRLYAAAARLRQVQIEQDDAINVIRRYDQPGALFLVDPPYPAETRGRWKDKGYAVEMDTVDHERLADVLHDIRGAAIVCGYPCDLYDRLYADWERHTCQTTTDGGFDRTEAIWLSPGITAFTQLRLWEAS